ncbi:MAG TPA: pyridine nucleotide-disulfide oxidoreductase, partial [Chitinophagaceae bacterium]|nr:pyridine nucleotide-disulfide oxidoreductase [Chitinophagaceae bacterium]
MEQTILSANPHLKKIFSGCQMLWREPVTISQISFDKKDLVHEHVLMTGDAAGMITPLCGNGMSMALHASKIAAEQIREFLKKQISREEMERNYADKWNKLFANRMKAGRLLQKLMLNRWLIRYTIRVGKAFPGILRFMIRQTHGRSF